jgi:hypothetical protein
MKRLVLHSVEGATMHTPKQDDALLAETIVSSASTHHQAQQPAKLQPFLKG